MTHILRGQLSKATGIHFETIRFYEKIGLIPAAEKNDSGFRIYSKDTIGRLYFIKHAKSCGFTLEEIKNMLQLVELCDDPSLDTDSILNTKIEELKYRAAEINSMIELLQQAKEHLK
jgi:DNA-binding transcriptional MerR regulator